MAHYAFLDEQNVVLEDFWLNLFAQATTATAITLTIPVGTIAGSAVDIGITLTARTVLVAIAIRVAASASAATTPGSVTGAGRIAVGCRRSVGLSTRGCGLLARRGLGGRIGRAIGLGLLCAAPAAARSLGGLARVR
jgi:hypothetical protein